MGTFKWICSSCGHRNSRDGLDEPKICSHCGHNDSMYELPEDDGNTRGYM